MNDDVIPLNEIGKIETVFRDMENDIKETE